MIENSDIGWKREGRANELDRKSPVVAADDTLVEKPLWIC